MLRYIDYSDAVGEVKDFGLTGRPGGFLSLSSTMPLILGLPLQRTIGGGEIDSSPLFDNERGFLPGFSLTALDLDVLYLSR